ncbi:MAG: S9 family peptidase [Candidatus Sungbacteria bacterium]|nr:S9 family peptidase [Candidatus Sungbacteria bacterium]
MNGYKLFLCVLLLSLPTASSAFTYTYYKPLDSAEDNLLLSWGPFGSLENYNCNLNDYSCSKTNQKNFPKNADIPIPTDQEWYNPGKSLAIYRTLEKTASEKVTRYFLASYAQTQWSSGRQVSITDDIQKIYWPQNNSNEFVYITKEDAKGRRDFVRFNSTENKETARKTVSEYVTNGTLSLDGLWLAYYVPLKDNKKSTVLLHLLSPVQEYRFDYAVPKNWELLSDANRLLTFSASSSRFAFLEDSNNFPVARVVDLENGASPVLNSAEIIAKDTIGMAADLWFSKEDVLLVAGNDKKSALDWHLYSYNISTKQLTSPIPDISYRYEIQQIGNLFLVGKMSGPNLIPVLYDPDTEKYHEFNLEKSTANPTLSKEVMPLKNGFNGVLIKSKKTKISAKTPLVVWLHGGPFRQIAKEYHSYPSYAVYDWVLDQLASQGAVIFKIDYAGSYGYGNDAAYSVVNNVGKRDVADVYDSVKAIKKKLNLKGGVYLMGNSFGGYLGPRTLVAYPKEFSGAIAINGVFEWRTLLNYLRTSLFNTHFDGLYDPNDAAIYNQASITNRVKGLSPRQKIVIIHGMADKTINPDQSYTFHELLKNMGKNTKIVSIPEEDHVFLKPSSIETICKASSEAIGFKTVGAICQFK